MAGEELEKAKRIKAALDLVKQGMSVQKAANMYSLPRRTLRYHLTHKESFDIEAYTGGRKSALSSQLEKRLGEWVDQMVERGFTVDMALICEKAKLLAQKINLNNFQASSTWFFRVGFFSFIFPYNLRLPFIFIFTFIFIFFQLGIKKAPPICICPSKNRRSRAHKRKGSQSDCSQKLD